MNSSLKTQISSLGYLRLGLIGLAIVSMLIPMIAWLLTHTMAAPSEHSLLSLSAGLIAPVMAPMLIVVILLDFIMAKVRAVDDPSGSGDLYRLIGRIDTVLIIVMLVFWVPFFISLTS